MTGADTVAFAKRVEKWGYGALWLPEVTARDPMVTAALVLANTTTDSVQYLLYSKGQWSAVKSLGLNEKFSVDAAFAALAKMAATAE